MSDLPYFTWEGDPLAPWNQREPAHRQARSNVYEAWLNHADAIYRDGQPQYTRCCWNDMDRRVRVISITKRKATRADQALAA